MVHCHPYTTLSILPKHNKQKTNKAKPKPNPLATTVIVIPPGHLTSPLVLLNTFQSSIQVTVE